MPTLVRLSRPLPLPAASKACHKASPVQVVGLKEPRSLRRLAERCVTLKGWWRLGGVAVPTTQDGVTGFRVLRPFGFVREKNPSLGWPSWFALDVVLVDQGFFVAADVEGVARTVTDQDAMFEEPVELTGVVRKMKGALSRSAWLALQELAVRADASPHGEHLLELVLQPAEAAR